MPLPGDCQTNLQSKLFGTVGVGDGDANRAVGVSDSSGVADGISVEVWVGSAVGEGLGVGESVGSAVLEGVGMAVAVGAANGADSATQAARGSVRPMKSNAFLIVAFIFYSQ